MKPRASVRPARNAAEAPSVLPMETATVPSPTPRANPAPRVSSEPGTNSNAAGIYAAPRSTAPHGPILCTEARNQERYSCVGSKNRLAPMDTTRTAKVTIRNIEDGFIALLDSNRFLVLIVLPSFGL